MDLNKSIEIFNPKDVIGNCHIIGCGSIGSNVAELLVRQGVTKLTLWDEDVVKPHNIVNQLFTEEDINKPKTEALKDLLTKINHDTLNTINLCGFYSGDVLDGYVFMCVDDIDVRKNIIESNLYNSAIKAVFDFRTAFLQGQTYLVHWNNLKEKESIQNSMDFTHEEAAEISPVTACGYEISIAPVVRMTAEMGIVNFTNLISNKPTKHLIICEPYNYMLEAY